MPYLPSMASHEQALQLTRGYGMSWPHLHLGEKTTDFKKKLYSKNIFYIYLWLLIPWTKFERSCKMCYLVNFIMHRNPANSNSVTIHIHIVVEILLCKNIPTWLNYILTYFKYKSPYYKYVKYCKSMYIIIRYVQIKLYRPSVDHGIKRVKNPHSYIII